MSATLKDIAKLAGVHTSTVSRVLRKKETQQVSPQTREKILSIAKELNYSPNQLAQAFRLRRSYTIALIIPDISNAFFAGIAKTIEIESYKAGYNLVVCNTDEEQEKELRYMQNLIKRNIDGIIIAPSNQKHHKITKLLKKVPYVLIDRCFDDLVSNAVISNNAELAYNAVEYLASYNHNRIGFICSRKEIYTIKNRLKGYYSALKDFDLDNDKRLVSGNGFTEDDGYYAAKELLSLSQPPTAVISSGNTITIGVMRAIKEKGLSIPSDISVIAFSDTPCAPFWSPPLTTISHPFVKMGKEAIKILLSNIETDSKINERKVVIKAIFNKRKSVGSPSNK